MKDQFTERINEVIKEFTKVVKPSVEGAKLSTMIFSLIGELQGTILALKLKNADRR